MVGDWWLVIGNGNSSIDFEAVDASRKSYQTDDDDISSCC